MDTCLTQPDIAAAMIGSMVASTNLRHGPETVNTCEICRSPITIRYLCSLGSKMTDRNNSCKFELSIAKAHSGFNLQDSTLNLSQWRLYSGNPDPCALSSTKHRLPPFDPFPPLLAMFLRVEALCRISRSSLAAAL